MSGRDVVCTVCGHLSRAPSLLAVQHVSHHAKHHLQPDDIGHDHVVLSPASLPAARRQTDVSSFGIRRPPCVCGSKRLVHNNTYVQHGVMEFFICGSRQRSAEQHPTRRGPRQGEINSPHLFLFGIYYRGIGIVDDSAEKKAVVVVSRRLLWNKHLTPPSSPPRYNDKLVVGIRTRHHQTRTHRVCMVAVYRSWSITTKKQGNRTSE